MSQASRADVTRLLVQWRGGDAEALDRLVRLVYTELRRIAHRYMRDERPGHPLQTTALVHEAYLRLIDVNRVDWESRNQFYAVSARMMRRILVEEARKRNADKRGADPSHVALDEGLLRTPERGADVLALEEALERLEALDERKARVVELRCFGGLSVGETAAALGVSEETVFRDWRMAKLWLRHELTPPPAEPGRTTQPGSISRRLLTPSPSTAEKTAGAVPMPSASTLRATKCTTAPCRRPDSRRGGR